MNFVAEKYDKELVRKLNKAMREGEYREEIWKVLTKKTVKELDEEWRESMKKGAAAAYPQLGQIAIMLSGPGNAPTFQIHRVPDGWASVIADMLRTVVPRDLPFRVSATPPSQILVYTDPQTQAVIRLLVGSDGQRLSDCSAPFSTLFHGPRQSAAAIDIARNRKRHASRCPAAALL